MNVSMHVDVLATMPNVSMDVNVYLRSGYTRPMAVTDRAPTAPSSAAATEAPSSAPDAATRGPATAASALVDRCCAPLTVDVVDAADAELLAGRFKAIADPVRLQILSRLAAAPDGVCVCDFVDDLERSQPTISHHLKVLADAGLVTREQRGKWAWFSIVAAELDDLADFLRPR